MRKLAYFITLCVISFVGFSSCTKDDVEPKKTVESTKEEIELPISGSYKWEFKIPVGKQVLTMDFTNELIKLKMVGEKNGYNNDYEMVPLSYNKTEKKLVAVGKGGKSISKEGVYFVILFKDIDPYKSVTIFKKEFKTKEEAEKFTKPADDTKDSHGWNKYSFNPNVTLPISGTYTWKFTIPKMGNQDSQMTFSNTTIVYKMTGDVYNNEYEMIPLSYDEKEQKIVAVGKGGVKEHSKEGKYFVIFLKDIKKNAVTIFKNGSGFDTKEEAEKYVKPADNETKEHGWNVYKADIKLPISGKYSWSFNVFLFTQTSSMTFGNENIPYKMEGSVHSADYNMVVLSYDEKDQKIVTMGEGSKENKYFVIFLKDIDKDKVTIFKKEFETEKEAEEFAKPADDTTDSHGWNIYTKQ